MAARDDDEVDKGLVKKSRFTMRRRDSGTGVVTIDLTGGSASRLMEAAEKSKKGGSGGGDIQDGSSSARQKVRPLRARLYRDVQKGWLQVA